VTRRWFLPEMPDVLGMLRAQLDTTEAGMVAFAAWAHGDGERADEVRAMEHRADDQKRELWRALRNAFVTPVDAEDLWVLSAGLDEVLNRAKDTVRESDVMLLPPDPPIAEMVDFLVAGVGHVGEAFAHLGEGGEDATGAADAAVKSMRALERVYRKAMSDLLDLDDLRLVTGRRELYGRVVAISDQMRLVAERVWYAVVKES